MEKAPEKLEDILVRHPLIFGQYKKGNRNFDEMPPVYCLGFFTDNWGCVWRTVKEGLEGQVVGHPLADWKAFENYQPPDPLFKTERGERGKNIGRKLRRPLQNGGRRAF